MILADNLGRISKIKRDQVMSCIDIAEKHSVISKMIIFGSSVTDDCLETSDVDICLELNPEDTRGRELCEITSALVRACDYNCDILKYHKLGETFKKEVDKKGVLVYELS